jgi:hypothetical protein
MRDSNHIRFIIAAVYITDGSNSMNIGDRYIPARAGNKWQNKFVMISVSIFNNL